MLAVLADMSPDPGARDNSVTSTVAENAYLLYLIDPTFYLLFQISTSTAWHWLPFVYILLCKYVRASAAAGPDSRFDYEETVLVVVDGSAVAIAEAIVTATVDASSRCHASVDTGSGTVHPTTPTPAPVHTPGGHVDTHAPHPVHPHAHTLPAPAPTRPTPAPSGPKRSSHPKRRHAKRGHKVSKKGGRKVAKKGGHRGARKIARKPVRKPVRKGGRKNVPKGGRRGGHKVQQKRLRKGGRKVERKGAQSAKRRAPRRRPRRGHAA